MLQSIAGPFTKPTTIYFFTWWSSKSGKKFCLWSSAVEMGLLLNIVFISSLGGPAKAEKSFVHGAVL